ncbi:MAG: phosphate ABC transporter ATP-binding protein PstB [Thermodesulfobacteriota bacterium]
MVTEVESAVTEQAFHIENLSVHYGAKQAVRNVSFSIPARSTTALIGPSGCGKSTLLRCLNRMNDLVPSFRMTGKVSYDRQDLYARGVDVIDVRRKIGMVFQKPNPFPKSIYENIAFGLRIQGIGSRSVIDGTVEASLRKAALWDEVKDSLDHSALALSGGQQQRLCIARALAVQPEAILMDEPCSALDPISTGKIEDLSFELRKEYTVVVVTHNMQQAARISENTAFFMLGEIVEYDLTKKIFTNPSDKLTEDYVTGRFG